MFTGGIGENGVAIRHAVCDNLQSLDILLDDDRNSAAEGEAKIHTDNSRTQLWVIPTNEEIIVARQTKELLEG